ncbi:DUF222 domain-containing protein [Georgenia ruanii]|uniref:DUF222 domain-containing protein n=1 Tax=Georgenia ruanii TaxID=348442 RepID=UPI00186B13E5|nr:DUF222 domain-containing protein [Georgenia ruanii]
MRNAVRGLTAGAPGANAVRWEQRERESVIAGLDAAIQSLTIYRGQVLLAHKEDGRWGTALDRDFADWRARSTGTGRGPAVGELQVAEGLQAMPEVADAVADGELTLEHARTFARLRATASEEVKAALEGGAAADLLEKAKHLSAPELAREAKKVAASIDARAAQEQYDAVWRRRSVSTRRSAGGRAGAWFLDDIGGTIVETALDAILGKPAKDDVRTREQRRADALVTMASRVLQVGADRNGAQIRPHLALIVSEETWDATLRRRRAIEEADRHEMDAAAGWPGAALGLDADGLPMAPGTLTASATPSPAPGAPPRSPRAASGPASPGDPSPALPRIVLRDPPPLANVPPAELEDGSLVPGQELERLMCDCEVTRIVMNAASVPLDVGRTERVYNREMRRAITTRDRHCQWPGCSIRASWCEVHHVWFFADGGPTSLANGCTLCVYHHHRVHQEHIRITILGDGFDFHYRDGRHLGTTKRRRGPVKGTRNAIGLSDEGLTPERTTCHDPLVASWPPDLRSRRAGTTSTGPAASAASGSTASAASGSAARTTTIERGAPEGITPADARFVPAPATSPAADTGPPSEPAPPPSGNDPLTLWDADLPPGQSSEPPF